MIVPGKSACLAAALALAASTAVAQTFNGPTFRVETYTTGTQGASDVAVDSGGHFIVTWAGYSDTDDLGVYARRYRSSGVPLGPAFRVNTTTAYEQTLPAVAVDANGRFVVVWQAWGQDGDQYGVEGQLFAPDGTPIGGEFQVNTWTTGYQYLPDVAFQPDGTFVVAWQSDYQDGSGYGIAARRFDNNGAPLGADFVVNSYTTGYQYAPKVLANASGFAVAWDGQGGGDNYGIFARAFLPNGAPVPVPPFNVQFRVNSTVANYQRYVSAGAGGNNFVVAWEDITATAPEQHEVFARRYNATTFLPDPQFQVNTVTTDYQGHPAVAVDRLGQFVVAWSSGAYSAAGQYDVRARMFSAAGAPTTGDFAVNSYTTGFQWFPAAGAGGPGDFLITWEGEDDGSVGVLGQRFGDLIFSDDVESGSTIFWGTTQPNMTAAPEAALNATDFGLRAQVNGNAGVFVEDPSPDNENRYRARFYLDPNTHDPGEALLQRRLRVLVLFEESPTKRLAAVVLRRISGQFALMARAQLDDDTHLDTGFTNITDAPHWVEIDWQRSSSPVANDGHLFMQIDGVAVTGLNNLNNNAGAVDFVRLGTISNKSSANGVVFTDEFVSRRINAIGQ
jgi:hypothetical protein